MEVSQKQLEQLNTQVKELHNTCARILMYIESDPKTKTPGLVETVSTINNRVAELEDDKKKARARMTLISSFIGFLIVLGKELIGRVWPD